MTDQTATNPVAADALRLIALEVATGPRAMFYRSTSTLPMLRGPTVAYAADGDEGAAAPGGGDSAAAPAESADSQDADIDEDRAPAPDDDDDTPTEELDEDGKPKPAEDDDTEEVEHDGGKYKVPKALKDAFLRQADYTQKTQALADSRKALDTDRTAWQSQKAAEVETVQALREEIGKVETVKARLAAFAEIDWADAYQEAAGAENPAIEFAKVVKAEAAYKALQVQAGDAEKALAEKIDTHLKSQDEAHTQRIQEVGRVLSEKIPDFGREKAAALMEFAAQEGVSVEEMQAVDDPRTWLLLNRAHALQTENAALKAQLAAKTTVDRHAKAQETTPAASVRGGAAPQTGPTDRQGTDAWMERRNAQLAKRAKG